MTGPAGTGQQSCTRRACAGSCPASPPARGRVEHIPDPAGEASRPERSLNAMLLVRFGDGRKADHLPGLLLEHVADQIVLVQPLHDQHDRAMALVVQPAVERMLVPGVGGSTLRVRQGLIRLERVVDHDQVGASPGQHASDRGREPEAVRGRGEFLHRMLAERQPCRKELLVPSARHDGATITRQLVRQVLGIADAQDLSRRIMAQAPGRQCDRGAERLEVAWRNIDDEAPDRAATDLIELCRHHLHMPVQVELGLRVEVVKATLDKRAKILPQDGAVLSRVQIHPTLPGSRRTVREGSG